ncbi:DUF1048 domain-containing protein [Microbacterium sp.]|uniref:DUF1048 domain-containing protein n=1 Tax=Microbacterium sp. TaxID=51671 RepID=UPI0039E6AFFE
MSIRDIIDGKRQWRAHMARIKALPPDYRIVYAEMQKYLFKVGTVSLTGGNVLAEIADYFEDGAASGKSVTELIGPDVATFCDGLIGDSPTYADLYHQAPTANPDTNGNPNQ